MHMAFNPFITFQKNRRFLMAAILMVCMVTFVFCTGGLADKMWEKKFIRGSPAVTRYNDPTAWFFTTQTITEQDLRELKIQRNFASEFALNCCEMSFRKLSKAWFDVNTQIQAPNAKANEMKARKAVLIQLQLMIETIAYRKNKPRFYEGGVKLDDLLEFKMWLAQADKMGIRLQAEAS